MQTPMFDIEHNSRSWFQLYSQSTRHCTCESYQGRNYPKLAQVDAVRYGTNGRI